MSQLWENLSTELRRNGRPKSKNEIVKISTQNNNDFACAFKPFAYFKRTYILRHNKKIGAQIAGWKIKWVLAENVWEFPTETHRSMWYFIHAVWVGVFQMWMCPMPQIFVWKIGLAAWPQSLTGKDDKQKG